MFCPFHIPLLAKMEAAHGDILLAALEEAVWLLQKTGETQTTKVMIICICHQDEHHVQLGSTFSRGAKR